MQNAMKNSNDNPPLPPVARDRLRKERYPLISSSGSLLNHSQPAATPTTTGIPTKRSSQKIAFKMKVTRFAIDQRPSVAGTNPVDWAFFTNHKNTYTAPACASADARTKIPTAFQCFLMSLLQSEA